MNLAIIGTGNIGLVTALCFADKGHQVFCVDNDQQKIQGLQQGQTPIYEPLLNNLLQKHIETRSISFSLSLPVDTVHIDCVFICIGTPNLPTGQTHLAPLEKLIEQITSKLPHTTRIVIRSTVPPGTNKRFSELYPKHQLISSPEFLREGSAIYDCLNPSRIVIGSNNPSDLDFFKGIYKDFNLLSKQFLFMDATSAEMSKYAANIFLANRVALINEFSRLADKAGCNIQHIQSVLSSDARIGPHYLNAGVGYGGSCFPKDLEALIYFARGLEESAPVSQAIKLSNELQIQTFIKVIKNRMSQINGTTQLTIWGLSFKPETDDIRHAPSLKVIESLLENNQRIKIYDPKASKNVHEYFNNHENLTVCTNITQAAQDTNALIICTEWEEFINYDLTKLKPLMRTPAIFDGRNIYEPQKMKELGFEYYSIGRPS